MALGSNRARRLERAEAVIGWMPPNLDPTPEELALYADIQTLVGMPVAEYFRAFNGDPALWPELPAELADRILSFLTAGADAPLLGTWGGEAEAFSPQPIGQRGE